MGERLKEDLQEKVVHRGEIFELVHEKQLDGRNFEIARRTPGVRIIFADKEHQKVLLTREFRHELQGWDYRLPGGKVFDSLKDYEAHRESGADILEAALDKAKDEGREEAGINIDNLELCEVSVAGGTVKWDLYVFEATKWRMGDGQSLEEGEEIETGNWFDYSEAEAMIMSGQMQEGRIALALLRWIYKQKEASNEV